MISSHIQQPIAKCGKHCFTWKPMIHQICNIFSCLADVTTFFCLHPCDWGSSFTCAWILAMHASNPLQHFLNSYISVVGFINIYLWFHFSKTDIFERLRIMLIKILVSNLVLAPCILPMWSSFSFLQIMFQNSCHISLSE